MNWDSKRRAYSCFPIELDWVLGFTVPVQPNLRAVKCQHALVLIQVATQSPKYPVGCPSILGSLSLEQCGEFPGIYDMCIKTHYTRRSGILPDP